MRDRYKIMSRRDETGKIKHKYMARLGNEPISCARDDYIVIEIKKHNERLLNRYFLTEIVTNIRRDR